MTTPATRLHKIKGAAGEPVQRRKNLPVPADHLGGRGIPEYPAQDAGDCREPTCGPSARFRGIL